MKRFTIGLSLGFCMISALPLIAQHYRDAYRTTEAYFALPVPPKDPDKVFLRRDSFGKGFFGAPRDGGRTHKGIDLEASVGEPVYAARSGRVAYAGEGKGYGLYVEVQHPEGFSTRYAHLSTIEIFPAAWVEQGQVIGRIGKSGNAENPKIVAHLHFEIRYRGRAMDPGVGLLDPRIRLHSR